MAKDSKQQKRLRNHGNYLREADFIAPWQSDPCINLAASTASASLLTDLVATPICMIQRQS